MSIMSKPRKPVATLRPAETPNPQMQPTGRDGPALLVGAGLREA
jgi:hypothetical protein